MVATEELIIPVESNDLNKVNKDFTTYLNTLDKINDSTDEFISNQGQGQKALTSVTRRTKVLNEETAKTNELIKDANARTRRRVKELNAEKGSINALIATTNRLVDRRRRLNLQSEAGRKEFERLTNTISKNNRELKKLDSQIGRNQRNVGNYSGSLSKLATSFGNVTGLAVGVSSAIAGIGFVVGESLKAFAQFEQSQIAFETLTGSAEQGKETLTDLLNLAKTSPFSQKEVIDVGKNLLATGTEAENLIERMILLGNISSGVGRENLPNIARALSQVQAATKLTAQEANQFANSSVNIFKFLEAEIGISAGEIKSRLNKDLEIPFETVLSSLERTTEEGGLFFNLMANQSKTLGGVFSNFLDNINIKLIEVGSNFAESAKSAILFFNELIEGSEAENIRDINRELAIQVEILTDLTFSEQSRLSALEKIRKIQPELVADIETANDLNTDNNILLKQRLEVIRLQNEELATQKELEDEKGKQLDTNLKIKELELSRDEEIARIQAGQLTTLEKIVGTNVNVPKNIFSQAVVPLNNAITESNEKIQELQARLLSIGNSIQVESARAEQANPFKVISEDIDVLNNDIDDVDPQANVLPMFSTQATRQTVVDQEISLIGQTNPEQRLATERSILEGRILFLNQEAEALEINSQREVDIINSKNMAIAQSERRLADLQIIEDKRVKDSRIRSAKITGKILSSLSQIVGNETRAQFEAQKALAIGSAIVNTASGVTEALPNIPLAVAVGLAGVAEIATISRTEYGKGSTGSQVSSNLGGLSSINTTLPNTSEFAQEEALLSAGLSSFEQTQSLINSVDKVSDTIQETSDEQIIEQQKQVG